MKLNEIIARLQTFPGSTMLAGLEPGTARFKVNHKVFAECGRDSDGVDYVTVKMSPELADILRDSYKSVVPGYNMQKQHWSTVLMTGEVPRHQIELMLQLSYRNVVAASGLAVAT